MTHAIIKTSLHILIKKLLLIAKKTAFVGLNLVLIWLIIQVKILKFTGSKLVKKLWNFLPVTYVKKFLKSYFKHHKLGVGSCSFSDSHLSILDPARSGLRRDKLQFFVSLGTNRMAYYFYSANTPESSDTEESEDSEEQEEITEMEVYDESIRSSEVAAKECKKQFEIGGIRDESSPESRKKMDEFEDDGKVQIKRKVSEIGACSVKRKKSSNISPPQAVHLDETFDYSENLNDKAEVKNIEDKIINKSSNIRTDKGIQTEWPKSNKGILCEKKTQNKKSSCNLIEKEDSSIVEVKSSLEDIVIDNTTINEPDRSVHSERKGLSINIPDPSNTHNNDPASNSDSGTQSHGNQPSDSSFATPVITDTKSLALDSKIKEDSKFSSSKQSNIAETEIKLRIAEILGAECDAVQQNETSEMLVEFPETQSEVKAPELRTIYVIKNHRADMVFGNMPMIFPDTPSLSSKTSDPSEKDSSSSEESINNSFIDQVIDVEENPEEQRIPDDPEKLKSMHKLSELYENHPLLKDLTDRLEFYSEAIKSIDITDMNDNNSMELWRRRLTRPESRSTVDNIEKLDDLDFENFIRYSQNSTERHKNKIAIASVSPIKVRNENYKPYPGNVSNPSQVKKDARYQKKFYRRQSESTNPNEVKESEGCSKSSLTTPESISGTGSSKPSQGTPEPTSGEGSSQAAQSVPQPMLSEGSSQQAQTSSKLTSDEVKYQNTGNVKNKSITLSNIIDEVIEKSFRDEQSQSKEMHTSLNPDQHGQELSEFKYILERNFRRNHASGSIVSAVSSSTISKTAKSPNAESPESLSTGKIATEPLPPIMVSQISNSAKSTDSDSRENSERSKEAEIILATDCSDLGESACNIQPAIESEEHSKSSVLEFDNPRKSEKISVIRDKYSKTDTPENINLIHEKDVETGESSGYLDHGAKRSKTKHDGSESEIRSICESPKKDEIPETNQKSEYLHKKFKSKRSFSDLTYNAPLEEKCPSPIRMTEENSANSSCEKDHKRSKMDHEETVALDEEINKSTSISIDKTLEKQSNIIHEKDAIEPPFEDEENSERMLPFPFQKKITVESCVNVKDNSDKVTEMDCEEISEKNKNVPEPLVLDEICTNQQKLGEKSDLDEQNKMARSTSIPPVKSSEIVSCESLPNFTLEQESTSTETSKSIPNRASSLEILPESESKSCNESSEQTIAENENEATENMNVDESYQSSGSEQGE